MSYVPPPTQPGNRIDVEMQPSGEPQQNSLPTANIEQPIPSHELRPKTEPGNAIADGVRKGYEPQQISRPHATISQEGRFALGDMKRLFLAQRKYISVNVCYSMLPENTREYLRSLRHQ